MFEQYTLVLRHEMVGLDEKTTIDPPLVIVNTFNRRSDGAMDSIILNRMMDELKDELFRRQSGGKG